MAVLVIGGRDMEAGAVSVRLHHGGLQGAKPKVVVLADILASIKDAVRVGTLAEGQSTPSPFASCAASEARFTAGAGDRRGSPGRRER